MSRELLPVHLLGAASGLHRGAPERSSMKTLTSFSGACLPVHHRMHQKGCSMKSLTSLLVHALPLKGGYAVHRQSLGGGVL